MTTGNLTEHCSDFTQGDSDIFDYRGSSILVDCICILFSQQFSGKINSSGNVILYFEPVYRELTLTHITKYQHLFSLKESGLSTGVRQTAKIWLTEKCYF